MNRFRKYPKSIYRGFEPIGVCGHRYGKCTCDAFEIDLEATQDAVERLESGYEAYQETFGKGRRYDDDKL